MDGQNVINEIAFSQSVINIGADSGNDIVLRGAKVTGFHAMLNYTGSTWHLIPLDPGFPVLLNGRGIGPEGSTLPNGSVLTIGDYRLTVSLNGINADILVSQTAPSVSEAKDAEIPAEMPGKNILLTITNPGAYEVETGSTVEYELTVTNAGPLVANMQIQLQGVPSSWVQIIPPVLNLNESRRGTFQVRISPPRDPSSEAGEYYLHFVAISPNYPGETATADTSLMVMPFRQFMLSGPNPRRLNLKRTHREDYSDVVILNQSNSETTYMVRSFDDGNDLNYAYKLENASLVQGQDTVTIRPGESVRVPVQVGARKAPVFGFTDHIHHYYTSVTPSDDPTSAQSVVGEVHVRPLINGFWMILFILLILLMALFIFQPYIYQFSTISGKQTEVIVAGESVTVDWRTSPFASNVTLTEGNGGTPETVDKTGSMVLTPKVSTTYRLRSQNILSQLIGITYEHELNVLLIPARPSIDLFTTDLSHAYFEQPVNLKWAVGDNAENAFVVINKQRTDLTKENYSGAQENKFNSDTLLWLRAQNQSGFETKSLFVNVEPDRINLNRFTAWVRPNGIAVPSDNDVRRTTRWGSLANVYGTVPTPQTLRPANVNPMPAPQNNVLEIPDNYGSAPYTGAVSPEQQLLNGSDSGISPSGAELLVSPSLVSTPAAPTADVPVIQPPMRTPVASATAPASSPERSVNREFSVKLAEVIEDPMNENGYRTIWYFDDYVLQKGEQVLIDWEISGVPTVKIENLSSDPVNATGSDYVYPEKNTNYTLEAEIGSLKKNYTLPLLVAGDADNGEGSGLNCELKANATTLTVPGSVMLTWSGGGTNRVQLISSVKAESENADAEKKKEEEAKAAGEPYTKPTNAPLTGGVIGDWLQPAGFMRVNVDKQTTFVLNAYDGNGNVICTKSAEVKYTGGNDKLDLKMRISKIADMQDNETKTFYVGQTAQFTVRFSDFEKGKEPTGSVLITDGDSTCSVTLPKDTCSMVLKHEGTRKITAVYSGDNTYNKLTATDSVRVINKRSIQLDITKVTDDFPYLGGVSQSYYVVGQDVYYTVNLSKHMKGRIPTGTIKISDGTGSCTVTWPDEKTCSIKASKAGENIRITAEYSGDDVYKPAFAETTIEVLTKRPITFRITKVTDTDGNESAYYKLGQKYRVYTELSDYVQGLDPTGTIMITDGLSSCTVTLPDNACDLEARKLGEVTIKAIYSGDANYVTKIAETIINVSAKIKTTLELTQTKDQYPLRKLDDTADLEALLSWSKDAAGSLIPTGTITFSTFSTGNEVTGTCVLDLRDKTLSCDSEKPGLTENPGSIKAIIKSMLLADKTAARVMAEYSGDDNFLPSRSKIVPFYIQQKIPTELVLTQKENEYPLRKLDGTADLEAILSWDKKKEDTLKPTGTITFSTLGTGDAVTGTCVLDLVEKKLSCDSEDPILTDKISGENPGSITAIIKSMLLADKTATRVQAEYSGDDNFLPKKSKIVPFYIQQKIPTELVLTQKENEYPLRKLDGTADLEAILSWDKKKENTLRPTGTITFLTFGAGSEATGTCVLTLENGKLSCNSEDPVLTDKISGENPGSITAIIKSMVLADKTATRVQAEYSGDDNFLPKKSIFVPFEIKTKIPTKIEITDKQKTPDEKNKDVATADITTLLSWNKSEDDTTKPTGTIKLTFRNSKSGDTVTGTCVLDLATGDFSCDSDPKPPKLEMKINVGETTGQVTAEMLKMLLADKDADRVKAEYSGDENFLASETSIELFVTVPTTLKIVKHPTRHTVTYADIESFLKWDKDDNTLEREPRGTIKFTIRDGSTGAGGDTVTGTCILDLAKKENNLTCDAKSPVTIETDKNAGQTYINILDMLLADKTSDRIKAEYSGDGYFLPSESTIILFTVKEDTELDLITVSKSDDDKVTLTAKLHWESTPPDGQIPTGKVTFNAGGATCILNLDSKKFEKCSGQLPVDVDGNPVIERTDNELTIIISNMIMDGTLGNNIYAEYSGDVVFNKSTSSAFNFEKIKKIETDLEITDGKKYTDNKIDITTVLTLDEEVDPGDTPTGTITFTSGGATCVLNLKTEKFEECSGTLAGPVEIGPDNKTVTLTITDMVMKGTPGDSISAKFEKDPLYNDSTSPSYNFDGKIDTEITISVATKEADNKININKVLLTWLRDPVSGETPTGTITLTSGGSTCIVRLGADEPKFETCSGEASYIDDDLKNGIRIMDMSMNGTPGDSIYAKYNGDSLFNESTSSSLDFNKNPIKLSVVKITDKSGVEQPYFAVGQKVIVEVKLGEDELIVEPTGTVTVSVGTASCTLTYENTHQCEMTLPETAGELDLKANYPGDNYYLSAATDTMVIEVRKKQDIILEVVKITDMEGNEQSEYFINEQIIAEIELSGYDPAIDPSGEVTVVSESGTCTITLPGTSCSLKAAPYAGNHYLQAAYSGDDYYNKKNNVLSDMYKVVDRHKVNFTINQVTNDEDIKQEPPHYYVYDPVNHTGQKIHVYAVPFYTDDDQDRFDLNGKVTIVNPKTSESCTYTAPLAQFCELTLGPQTGELTLKARYEDNPYYVSRDAEYTIHVENRIKTEPIIQKAHKMLNDNLRAEIQLEFVYDRTLFDQYGVSPSIDNTHSDTQYGTISFTFSDDDGTETQCIYDLYTDTFAADCGDFVSKEFNTNSVSYKFKNILIGFINANQIKAEYNGNRFFYDSKYGPNPIGVEDQGMTQIDILDAVRLGTGDSYGFYNASLEYDQAVADKYSVRPADGIGKLTLTPVDGSGQTCVWDFETNKSDDCPTLKVETVHSTENPTVSFEISGHPLVGNVSAVKIRYGGDAYFLLDEKEKTMDVEEFPTVEIDHGVKPNGNSGTVIFKVSGIGPIAQKYHVYDQVEGKVSADGTTWKTPVCVFGLPGSSGQCGGTVSETGEGGYKLDNWTVSSPADYFGNTAKYVKMTLQSSVYTNLNTDGAPSSQKQFGLETKLTMFDVLYAHGYDFLETNLTYDKETLSSYVPTGKIKVTFLNADGNPYPTQTSDYEFTVSAPVSAGLIDDIATNIRMEWGAHYTAYAEYLGDEYFRYCKSETVTITVEDDPTLSITNAMKRKDSSDGMNYLYALFKISNVGTLWDKYGIIDGYELRNYPISSRIIKYPAVDQRPGAMVIQPAGYQNDGTVTETETGTFLVKGLKLGIGAGVDSGTGLQVSLTTPYNNMIVSGVIASKEYSAVRTGVTLTGSHKFLVQDTHIFLTSTLHIFDSEAKEFYGIDPSGTVTYTAGTSTCTFTFPDEPIEETYKKRYGDCTVSVEPVYTAAGKKDFTIKVLDWYNVSSSPGSVTMDYSGDGIHKNSGITANLVPSTPKVTINSAIKTSPTTASVKFTIDNYFDVNTYKEFLVYDYIQIGLSGSGGSMSKLVKIPEDDDFEIIGIDETINGKLLRNGNVFEIQDLEIRPDYEGYFSTFHAGLASYETYNGTGLVIDVEKDFTISGFGTSLDSPASSGSGSPVSLSLELEP